MIVGGHSQTEGQSPLIDRAAKQKGFFSSLIYTSSNYLFACLFVSDKGKVNSKQHAVDHEKVEIIISRYFIAKL